jgi:hypothetical protein
VGWPLSWYPRGIFNRCTGVYLARISFASGKVAAAIGAISLLARFAFDLSAASGAGHGFETIYIFVANRDRGC